MNRDETRASRTILRRIESHLRQSHLEMGAEEEAISFVDVIHHPNSALPSLNYVTPRKKTAWVSGNHLQQGIDNLREKGRTIRVRFAEGLYPPVFVRTLRELDLDIEDETPILIYKKPTQPRKMANSPSDVTFAEATSPSELAIWWYIWRNAYYDVAVSSVEPLLIGRDIQEVYLGRQTNIVMYRRGYPMGVMKLTFYEGTAHLVAHAMLKEMRESDWEKVIREVALDVALDKGADLIFVTGKTEEERKLYREIGFVDSSSIVTYAEQAHLASRQEETDDSLAQSVLVV